MDSVESDTTKTVFTYGDTIVVKVVGPSPKAANALSVEQKTIALLYGEAVLDTETVSEYGGTYYLTYETAGQKIPTGNSIQLQVVYGGNGNLKESTANVSVTLNPKPVTAVVENPLEKQRLSVYERLENLVTQRHPHFLLISLLQPHGATKQLFAYSKRAVHQL